MKIPWANSSAGRALHSHCRGQEFDSPLVHQIKTALVRAVFILFQIQKILLEIFVLFLVSICLRSCCSLDASSFSVSECLATGLLSVSRETKNRQAQICERRGVRSEEPRAAWHVVESGRVRSTSRFCGRLRLILQIVKKCGVKSDSRCT